MSLVRALAFFPQRLRVKCGRKKLGLFFSIRSFVFFFPRKKPTHADAVVDAPPRGQQARTRPPHERPGEGRGGAREFRGGGGKERARREEEDKSRKEKRAMPLCLFFVCSPLCLLHSSLVLLPRGEIKGRHLSCAEVVEWFEFTRKSPDSESFCSRRWSPEATDGEPRGSLETSLALGSPRRVLLLSFPLLRASRSPRRERASGSASRSKEWEFSRRIGHRNLEASDAAFFFSLLPFLLTFRPRPSPLFLRKKTRNIRTNRSPITSTPSTCTTSRGCVFRIEKKTN